MQSGINPVYVQVTKSKAKTRKKHVEADQKQQVVGCGTKRAWKTDTSGIEKCVPLYVTNKAYEVRQVERNVYHSPLHLLCTQ